MNEGLKSQNIVYISSSDMHHPKGRTKINILFCQHPAALRGRFLPQVDYCAVHREMLCSSSAEKMTSMDRFASEWEIAVDRYLHLQKGSFAPIAVVGW
jgi:hypothetical protein